MRENKTRWMATTTLGRIMHTNSGVSTCCWSAVNVWKYCLCSVRSHHSQGSRLVPLAVCLLGPRCAGLVLHCSIHLLLQPSSRLGEGGTARGNRGIFYFGWWGQWLANPTQFQFGNLCDLCHVQEEIVLAEHMVISDRGDLNSSKGTRSGDWCQGGDHWRGPCCHS